MTEKAYKEYERARVRQLSKNDARRIRTKIDDARKDPHLAGPRWPFELLQNAHDAHPRPGKQKIDLLFDCREKRVIFEHNSAPFLSSDLAALLSGGSGKEFESADTTGRFGTGFLSTHVLSTRVTISGIFDATNGFERFTLELDRAGDEDSIVSNIEACNASIRAAEPLSQLDGTPSARFEYAVDDDKIVDMGLEALTQALPYLFSTCENLGQVKVFFRDGSIECWTPSDARCRPYADAFVRERVVKVDGHRQLEYRTLRVSTAEGNRSAVLLVAQRMQDRWSVVCPDDNAPRLFRQFPIRPSNFLQTSLVIDAPFDVNQERNRVHLDEQNHERARAALEAWPAAIIFAFARAWIGSHRLARLSLSKTTSAAANGEQGFWYDELAGLAQRIALMPLIETRMGFLRAVEDDGDGWWADFLLPRLSTTSSAAEIEIEKFWSVANDVTKLAPPIERLVREWSAIGIEWHALKVPVCVATLETAAQAARRNATNVNQLNVEVDPMNWIARFVDLVGECWSKAGAVRSEILNGLLPDQYGKLRVSKDISKDSAIPESLKDTAGIIGYDVRARLLTQSLLSTATELELQFVASAIDSAVAGSIDEKAVVDTCLAKLDERFPANKSLIAADTGPFEGSIRLLNHVWTSKGLNGGAIAHRCPFIAGDKHITRCTTEPGKMMMAPTAAWHEAARPFAQVYALERILHNDYKGDAVRQLPDVVDALVRWGIAHRDPLIGDSPQELTSDRLRAIAEDPNGTQDVTVVSPKLSQIALLPNELISRCHSKEDSEDVASALLGLVLCYIAPHDDKWQKFITVRGRKKNANNIELRIRGAHWLAHLKTRSWIPVRAEDGKLLTVPATPESLRRLLELHPEWLKDNEPAVELLSQCFDFDELDLRLLGATSDDETRRKLRASLAKLVELTGANPDELRRLAEDVVEDQQKQLKIEHSRKLGLAVQDAIRQSLNEHGLATKLVDCGFDYEVRLVPNELARDDEPSVKIAIGQSYLVEVKSTRTGEVRLTPTQARTASQQKHRYVLCVVDLRSEPQDTLDREWAAADVEPLARIVPDIGASTEPTWKLVDAARSKLVGVRNDEELRYGVPESLWSKGVSIKEWVEGFVGANAPAATQSSSAGSSDAVVCAAPGA